MYIKSKAQKKWMLTLFLVISILLVIVTMLTTWVITVLSKEIMKLSDNLTSVVQVSIDSRLKEIENISLQVEMNAANLAISKWKDASNIQRSIAYPFGNQVRNYKLANRFIEHIYVYYPSIDYVVGDLGNFSTKNYYLLNNRLNESGFKQWKSDILEQDRKNYYFNGDELIFTRRLPYNDYAEATAVIVIHINRNEISNMLEGSRNAGEKSVTAMLNEDNGIYAMAGTETAAVIESMPSAVFEGEEMATYGSYYILKRASSAAGMIYTTVVDKADFLSLAYKIRNIAYLVLLCCLIGGFGLSIYVSKVNYKPLFSILSKVRGSGDDAADEYSLISRTIDSYIIENAKNHIRLEEQQATIDSLFLTYVLQSEQLNSKTIFASMQRLDIEFPGSQFAIMLIRTLPRSGAANEQERSPVKTHLQKRNIPYFYISADYQGDTILLFNIDNEVTLKDLEGVADFLYPLICEGRECFIALGRLYDSLSDIVKSYDQARKAADSEQGGKGGIYVCDAPSDEFMDTPIEHQALTAGRKSDGVAQRAHGIIEKEFIDPMLGLYSISERLGVTNTYLSKVFKDTYGQGLVQYINQLRVERAKALMLTSTLSVKDVAASVGFASDISFIRVFKQYTNTTPGKYKKQ